MTYAMASVLDSPLPSPPLRFRRWGASGGTRTQGKLSSGAPSFLKSVTLTTQRCATERRSLSDAYGAD